MSPDATLPAWIRYYASMLSVCLILGLGAALIYVQLRKQLHEASTIVVQSSRTLLPRQLGPVAQSLFRSSAVYMPVVRDLGGEIGIDAFLRERTELVPLPQAPGLVVLGRSSSRQTAEQISLGMAEQLVKVLNRQVGDQEFRIFSGPEQSRLPGDIGPVLILSLGVFAGLWSGAALALIHYRWRRPVLTLHNAQRLSGASQVTIIDNEKPSSWWKLVVEPRASSRRVRRNDVRLAWLERSLDSRPARFQALESGAAVKRLRKRLDSHIATGDQQGQIGSQDMLVMVASAGTAEDAILVSRLSASSTEEARQGRIALVWLR